VTDLWSTFVDDGGRHARSLSELLETGAVDPATVEAAGGDAYALATLALLMGVDEVGTLAHTVDRALAYLPVAPPGRHPALLGLVREAADAIAAAFVALRHADASGARTDAAPLLAAREALERFIDEDAAPEEPGPPGPPPPSNLWTPTVDDDMIELFFEEAHERLDGLGQKLVELEGQPGNAELVRDLFRDLHTLKGSSGMVGLGPMNRLAHAAEDLVGQIRDGKRGVDRPATDALLGALDGLRALVERAAARRPLDVDLSPIVARLRGTLVAPVAAPSVAPEPVVPSGPGPAKQTLRVDFDKLDLLLNLVGELVLSKAGLAAGIGSLGSLGRELESDRRLARRAVHSFLGRGRAVLSPDAAGKPLRELSEELGRVERVFLEVAHDLETSSARLDRVSAELRDQVIKLRMVPIGATFRKHHRTVRDLALSLGKRARLELSGEDTELDKVLVEQIDDPLMHAVRNAIDHGIELPEARVAAGKPPEGRIRLHATHRGNQIVIEISDDGAGIDPVRLRAKALEKGVATAEELGALVDAQLLELIFRPGFSTAARVSEVSGRGVGMDVVRDTIVSRLKGTIEVGSTVGRGTTLTLRLPLTLAIIQVLLARAGGEVFAVPLDIIKRTLTVAAGDVKLLGDREVLPARPDKDQPERQIPLVRLREVLELDDGEAAAGEVHVILVDVAGATYGLGCDRLLGKQEIVIKSLGSVLENVPCAAGATLLGDRPAIILDVPALVARATTQRRRAAPPAVVPETAPAASAPRILLVEDSDTMRAAMQRFLESAGYQVTPARDGVEALRLAETQDFDLVSTDVMMPNLDGYELTRALRASSRHASTPILMVTSRGEKIDRVRGFDAGVDEYLTKPHDRQDFLAAVGRHLRNR